MVHHQKMMPAQMLHEDRHMNGIAPVHFDQGLPPQLDHGPSFDHASYGNAQQVDSSSLDLQVMFFIILNMSAYLMFALFF